MNIVIDTNVNKVVHVDGPVKIGGDVFRPTAAQSIQAAIYTLGEKYSTGDEASWAVWQVPMDRVAILEGKSPADLTPIIDEYDNVIDVQPSIDTTPELWVHAAITGGIVGAGGTLYLKNDGVDALQVVAQIKDGSDPATANPVTELEPGVPLSGKWALELSNVETGLLADSPLVDMVDGAINFTYITTTAPVEVELDEKRLAMIGPYRLRLAAPIKFKIVR